MCCTVSILSSYSNRDHKGNTFIAFPSRSPCIWHSAVFTWLNPDRGGALSFRCQREQECQLNGVAWLGQHGPPGLKNTNEAKVRDSENTLLLASPGRVLFDVTSCLILLCASALVLGRQQTVPLQQWGALECYCHSLKQGCMQVASRRWRK